MRASDFQPSPLAFHHSLRVDAADIDEFGHVNNVVWVRWVNDSAAAHASAVNMTPETCAALDAVWVVRRHVVDYLLPAFANQTLDVATWPHTVQGATSLRRTLFSCDGRALVRAETTWALLTVSTGRPRRIPLEMMRAYGWSKA